VSRDRGRREDDDVSPVGPEPARQALAKADLDDLADRSAWLWIRTYALGFSAAGLVTLAIVLYLRGEIVGPMTALIAAGAAVLRLTRSRREESRVFSDAVQTMEEARRTSRDDAT
jgi:hypothetical protein